MKTFRYVSTAVKKRKSKMKSVEFCYWLQGVFEMSDPKTFGIKETELIKKHLALVFKHEIDPSYPKEQQAELDDIHKTSYPSHSPNNGPIRC